MLTDNLVSYWKLDESSGNAADSVGSNTLTNTNTVTYVAGKINNGADLERDSTQYLAGGDVLDMSGNFSISAWIKVESFSSTTRNIIIGKWNDQSNQRSWQLSVNATRLCLFLSPDGAAGLGGGESDATTINTGTWYHIVCVFNYAAHTCIYYLNGSKVGNTITADATAIYNSTAPLRIGARQDSGGITDIFDGIIDEVGIWTRELSSTEVTSLYNSGNGFQYPFAVGPANLKSFNGLAKDSIKSINGLAIGSIKSVNGLA
jgi:hypothetical protein